MNEPGYTAPDITLIGEEHIDRYRETDGEEGYLWNGAPIAAPHHDRPQERRTAHLGADLRPGRRRLPRGRVDGRRAAAPVVVPQPHREPRRRGAGARATTSR